MPESVKAAWVPYGRTLKQLRDQAHLSCRQLAREASCAESLVSKVERGTRGVSKEIHSQLANALAARLHFADRRLGEAHSRAERAAQYTWHTDIADAEAEATSMQIWEPLLVPGICQTAAYAQAVFTDGRPGEPLEQISQLTGARMERVRAVSNKEIWVILDETALYRSVGGPQVMAEQLRYLRAISSLQHKITIFPQTAPYCGGLAGSIILLSAKGRVTAYGEHTAGGEIITDQDEVARISAVWRELSAWALSPSESIKALTRAVQHHEKG